MAGGRSRSRSRSGRLYPAAPRRTQAFPGVVFPDRPDDASLPATRDDLYTATTTPAAPATPAPATHAHPHAHVHAHPYAHAHTHPHTQVQSHSTPEVKSSIRVERGTLQPRRALPNDNHHHLKHQSHSSFSSSSSPAEFLPVAEWDSNATSAGGTSTHPAAEDYEDCQGPENHRAHPPRPQTWTDTVTGLQHVREQTWDLLRKRPNLKPIGVMDPGPGGPGLVVGLAQNAAPFSDSAKGTSLISIPYNSVSSSEASTGRQHPNLAPRAVALVAKLKNSIVTSAATNAKQHPGTSPDSHTNETEPVPDDLDFSSPDQRHDTPPTDLDSRTSQTSRRHTFPTASSIADAYPPLAIDLALERAIYEVKRVIREFRYDCSRRKNTLRITTINLADPNTPQVDIVLRFKGESDRACTLVFCKASRKQESDCFLAFYEDIIAELTTLARNG